MRKLLSAAAAVLLAAPASAATMEAVKAQPFAQVATAARFAKRPRVGTMTGGFAGAPVSLTFDRVEWTLTGGVNGWPLEVKIDHDGGKLTGGANGSPVDLLFAWTPDRVAYDGEANLSMITLTIDWKAKTIDGTSNHSPVHVDFDLEAGTAKGYANNAPVDLKFEPISGKLTGGINHAPVDATLVNMDLSDFLQYFWVFLKAQ